MHPVWELQSTQSRMPPYYRVILGVFLDKLPALVALVALPAGAQVDYSAVADELAFLNYGVFVHLPFLPWYRRHRGEGVPDAAFPVCGIMKASGDES